MHDPLRLIHALRNPALHGPGCRTVELLETHISWVLLTGDYAYKIKKPVDFGFLDFSTLSQRRYFCHEELRLNRRLAAPLYLEVVPITGGIDDPRLGGSGPVLEYAVKLRQFADEDLGDQLALNGRLEPRLLDDLAATLARFHQTVPRSSEADRLGLPATITEAAAHNFARLAVPETPAEQNRLERLLEWTHATGKALHGRFQQRKRDGFVRECHGDLHLGNLVRMNGQLVPFDCIEFSEDLRWIDVVSELAFLVMDLEVRAGTAPAFRLMNRYLEITGDYAGLELFDYYRVYRAMVRAKIASLSLACCGPDEEGAAELRRRLETYLQYAYRAVQPRKPRLLITHGFSGSGKSHLARRLAQALPAIRLASDVERKRLAGLTPDARTGAGPDEGIYARDFTLRTYDYLRDTARTLLNAGFDVILDATFLLAAHRQAQRELAEECGARFLILDLSVDESLLRERIEARLRDGADPSEAGLEVLNRQMEYAEPLDAAERDFSITVDAGVKTDIAALIAAVGD